VKSCEINCIHYEPFKGKVQAVLRALDYLSGSWLNRCIGSETGMARGCAGKAGKEYYAD
jgi:hypothetical protein